MAGLPPFRAVLFDVDGTLIDSVDLHAAAWQAAFRHYGAELPFAQVRAQIGKGGDNLMPALLPKAFVAEKGEEIETFRTELFQRDYLPRAVPFPGIRPLFERLAADSVRIVLASSSGKAEVAYHRGLIACDDLLFAATSKDDAERSKPCPDIFEVALARADVAPGAAIVVGDTPWDAIAAARSGLRTVALRHGGFDEADLVAAGAAALFDDLPALLAAWPRWMEPA